MVVVFTSSPWTGSDNSRMDGEYLQGQIGQKKEYSYTYDVAGEANREPQTMKYEDELAVRTWYSSIQNLSPSQFVKKAWMRWQGV